MKDATRHMRLSYDILGLFTGSMPCSIPSGPHWMADIWIHLWILDSPTLDVLHRPDPDGLITQSDKDLLGQRIVLPCLAQLQEASGHGS